MVLHLLVFLDRSVTQGIHKTLSAAETKVVSIVFMNDRNERTIQTSIVRLDMSFFDNAVFSQECVSLRAITPKD